MAVITRSASALAASAAPVSPSPSGSSATPPCSPARSLRSSPATPHRNKENFLPCGTPIPKSPSKRCKAKKALTGSTPRKTPRRTRSTAKALGGSGSAQLLNAGLDKAFAFQSGFGTVQAMLQDAYDEMEVMTAADRRARELTESPLADMSEAFI
ncbi:hypothetical protein FA95DRAFT_508582 [Auriscalpium vulgare]|uniref:Uncharacterized protein n=1 Tax=Auriscalpium vulgare TaxID=40419 RepID=A0ACB8RFY5_9AGAM|nr:hypothetical protein FA95DRAFT_508582 [Auriscalpium vulgare]